MDAAGSTERLFYLQPTLQSTNQIIEINRKTHDRLPPLPPVSLCSQHVDPLLLID
jgi:hypothetical protein